MGGILFDFRRLRKPVGSLPQAHTGRLSSTSVGAALQPQPDWILLRSRLIDGPRDLASVARYDEQDLPLETLILITEDTMLAFGWLASRAFYLWQQEILSGRPKATTLQAYNSFPVPKLGKKDRESLLDAARTITVSRSHLLVGSLTDLYAELPEQLAWAHSELDATVDRLLGISDDADDKQTTTVLLKAFEALAA